MRTLCYSLLLVLALPSLGWAQRYEELARRYEQPQIYHEAVALPAGTGATVVVSFRLSNQMLVFVRNRQGGAGRTFIAEPRVTVHLLEDGHLVAERLWQQPHYAATFDETQHQEVDLEGSVHFDPSPGAYTYRVLFKDEQSGREEASEPRSVTVPDFHRGGVGPPLLVCSVRNRGASVGLDLVNLGGDIAYGQAAYAVIPVGVPDSLRASSLILHYTLYRLQPSEEGISQEVMVSEGVLAQDAWMPVWGAAEAVWRDGDVHWPLTLGMETAAGYLVPLDLHGNRLEDGAYVLKTMLRAGAVEASNRFRFNTHWRNLPISLYHPEVAIRNLQFIEDRQTIKQMQKGSRAEQEARFRAYWKERDPTPETPFNELMAEYYRRVDYAAETFRTGQVTSANGLRTDQASVYIVHGPPERIDRTFPPGGGVQETWIYPGGRQFAFWAATSLDPFRLEATGR